MHAPPLLVWLGWFTQIIEDPSMDNAYSHHLKLRNQDGFSMYIYLFIYLFTYLFFICSWLTANKITAYNKNSYVYIHVNWHQLPNAEKTKNCKLNINLKKHL